MKRFVLIVVLLFLTVVLLGLAFYYWTPADVRGPVTKSDIAPESWSFKMDGNEFTVDGKTTVVEFVNTDTANVEVKRDNSITMKDKHVYVAYSVAIKGDQPVVLTKDSYSKIQNGMTFPQVAQALGGPMTKGRMSDGFHGRLDLGQGKRRMTLSFEDGKLSEKSAKDLE